MKVIKEPDKIQRCVFEVKESDSGAGYYWDGWCEGDKQGDRLNDGQPLTLLPEHFIGSTIVEILPTCPECGRQVYLKLNEETYEQEWVCEECE